MAVVAHQNVPRLDVAVHDSDLVRGVQGVGHLGHDAQRVCGVHPLLEGQPLSQRLSVHVLHDQIGEQTARSLDFAVVIDVDHAGALQRGDRARLAAKPLAEVAFVGEVGQQHLHRDRTPQQQVFATPHVAHSAAACAFMQPVAFSKHVT